MEASPTDRRTFLRGLAVGATTLVVAADASLAYRAYDQGVFAMERGVAFEPWKHWEDESGPQAPVAAAILAPSAHNSQPWRFAVADDRVDLLVDRSRSTGANDPLLREQHVSLGCALENMVIVARAHGYGPSIRLDTDPGSDVVASVYLETTAPTIDALYDAIPRRRTNRSEYTGDPVPADTISAIGSLVDDTVGPAGVRWLTADGERRAFADLLVEATAAHNADDEQSRDSFDWWRPSWDEVQEHRDGLSIDGVGSPTLLRTVAKLMPSPSRAASDATFLERTRIQAASAGAFGIITVDDPLNLEDQLAGGRLLQRLHLAATVHGLGFQHMNQVTERIDRDRELGRAGAFDARLLAMTAGRAPLVAFRIGVPKVRALASARRGLDEVLA